MVDLVGILEAHAAALGWEFSYGNAANKNLISSDKIADKVYLLMDPVTRLRPSSENGAEGVKTFTGSFMLLVKSNLDNVYHNQKGKDKTQGKYEKNILPLLSALESLENLIDCSDLQRDTWTAIDTVNSLDANFDGLVVTYSLSTL